ncbi:M3 family metallopeptidase [Pontibacillus salicampi]|uniref:M3 family metallopeptidase n=1 Tax=Pontibacillus salicampi TaxID=1449801 RepID=A0ABV6LKC8_9BACI
MSEHKYSKTWKIYSKWNIGSDLSELPIPIQVIGEQMEELKKLVEQLEITATPEVNTLEHTIHTLEEIKDSLAEISSLLTCKRAENTQEEETPQWKEAVSSLRLDFQSQADRLYKLLFKLEEPVWKRILDQLPHYQFILEEWRDKAGRALGERVEFLLEDGYYCWEDLYHQTVNDMTIYMVIGKENRKLTIAQTRNLRSHMMKDVRVHSFQQLHHAFEDKSNIFSSILNRIAGVRTRLCELRAIDTPFDEALTNNRIKKETLQVMWDVIERNKQPFIDYLSHRAKLFGNQTMKAYDFWAPINKEVASYDYDQGVDFVLYNLERYGTKMSNFAKKAFQQHWVEAEDRPNKSAYAFCAAFPLSGQSRVCMTYGGQMTDVLVLAHELGHAFHNEALNNVSPVLRDYPMTLAETASTYTEMIMLRAAYQEAASKEQQLFLLEEKLKRSVMNFMEIHSRYLFESKLYEERKQGYIPTRRLNTIMEESFNKGYLGSIDHLSPYAWATIPHYFKTEAPFYNFPYTFGYLFAMGIYAEGEQEGEEFESKYVALLEDSGRMSVEELAMKHLGADITQESFWENGMQRCIQDVQDFIHISEQVYNTSP